MSDPLDLDALEATLASHGLLHGEQVRALIVEVRRLREQVVDQLCVQGRLRQRIIELETENRKLGAAKKLTDKRRKENK